MITLSESGVIEKIEQCSNLDSIASLEFYSGILAPAMVNAHAHLELSHLGGVVPPQCGFSKFAQCISKSRNLFSEDECRNAMDFYDSKMWDDGICAVGDISNGSGSFETKRASKINYHTFLELFGLKSCDKTRLNKLSVVASELGLSNSLTAHSTYSLNCKDFDDIVQSNVEGILSIHFMESEGERVLYDGFGELHSWYVECGMHIDFDKYDSPVDRVISTIPSSRRVLLIHNTVLLESEINSLKGHFGDNLTFVLCPRSNLHITGEKPNFRLFSESGCRIALGTDSMASNSSLSLIEEMKEIEGVPLATQLKWATECGAEALGVGDQYGRIEIGRRCGLVLLESVDLIEMKLTSLTSCRRII